MSKTVREPIQVHLTPEERGALEARASEMGVSRSEVLRRGLAALSGPSASSTPGASRRIPVTSARSPRGGSPPSIPVAPLADLLAELADDRAER